MKSISKKLDSKLMNDFISVHRDKNPILKNLSNLTFDQKLSVICQYSLFPKNIVSFLIAATYSMSYHNWKSVVVELLQNINEEMGEGKGDIDEYHLPHYTILRKVVDEGFGFDIIDVMPSIATANFIKGVKTTLEDKNPEFVCGAVYALESSAVPELTLVKELIVNTANERELKIPQLLLDFFDYHIDEIEIGHRDRFLTVVSQYITEKEKWSEFEDGFNTLMQIMDDWWIALFNEIQK